MSDETAPNARLSDELRDLIAPVERQFDPASEEPLLARLRLAQSRLRRSTAGLSASRLPGFGTTFRDLRPYTAGDDVRQIDWQATARSPQPFVRRTEQEVDRRVQMILDASGSMATGTTGRSKWSLGVELAGLIGLLAASEGAAVGWAAAEATRPPRSQRESILEAVAKLDRLQPRGPGSLGKNIARFAASRAKPTTVVLVTDFYAFPMTTGDGRRPRTSESDRVLRRGLSVLSRRHEVWTVLLFDRTERALPPSGLIRFADPESGRRRVVDTDSSAVRTAFAEAAAERRAAVLRQLRPVSRVVEVGTDEQAVDVLTRSGLGTGR